ncbi:hypothetical protein [Paracoccus indicus]|uniref:hypothetical protein n=1 Tax=Paracoccus indicus TaxID=2079229 RepID=UPI000D38E579|nr:hypothetical protein [Paracoccus indicus]
MRKISLIKKKYDENPFADEAGFRVPVRRRSEVLETQAPTALISGDERIAVAEIRRITTVDSEPFVKVFTAELDRFFNLTPTALRITTILIQTLGKIRIGEGDQVYLSEKSITEAMEKTGIKPPTTATYYRALDELIRKGFIAPSTQTPLFYINPAIFFNGDRVRFVTEIRNKRTNKAETLEKRGQQALPFDPETGEITDQSTTEEK